MALTNAEMANQLSSLVKLDIDAQYAYGRLISIIDAGSLKNQLSRCQKDHERHINQLSAVVRALDSEPPLPASHSKYQMQDFTASFNPVDWEEAFCSIKANEELTNYIYRESSVLDFTPNIKELVARNSHDEDRHLKYIKEVLEYRLWEKEMGYSYP